MAPHSSTLAWKIQWMKEPDRLQSMGSQRVGHDWATSLSCLFCTTPQPWYHISSLSRFWNLFTVALWTEMENQFSSKILKFVASCPKVLAASGSHRAGSSPEDALCLQPLGRAGFPCHLLLWGLWWGKGIPRLWAPFPKHLSPVFLKTPRLDFQFQAQTPTLLAVAFACHSQFSPLSSWWFCFAHCHFLQCSCHNSQCFTIHKGDSSGILANLFFLLFSSRNHFLLSSAPHPHANTLGFTIAPITPPLWPPPPTFLARSLLLISILFHSFPPRPAQYCQCPDCSSLSFFLPSFSEI